MHGEISGPHSQTSTPLPHRRSPHPLDPNGNAGPRVRGPQLPAWDAIGDAPDTEGGGSGRVNGQATGRRGLPEGEDQQAARRAGQPVHVVPKRKLGRVTQMDLSAAIDEIVRVSKATNYAQDTTPEQVRAPRAFGGPQSWCKSPRVAIAAVLLRLVLSCPA